MSKMKPFRETNIDISEYEQSLLSEIDGLRDTCIELIGALRTMCISFPAPQKIKETISKFDYLDKEPEPKG